ncbi:hypothetical protein PGT21_027053 [Puccinia graminis f. sp. tritici]|uniref:Uncharacterized protein n=1 Tax=Puccinia graminis f. sp. tritici TaxID=56615 RepID=A0A5B0NPF1_PUCGR|nr:hypothetical protein PGT21_027053 [Puccinia graminis f. sp. tritici]
MITRKNATADNIHPLADPEAILKAGNTEKKRNTQNQSRPIAPLPLTSNTISETMSETIPPPRGQEQPAA